MHTAPSTKANVVSFKCNLISIDRTTVVTHERSRVGYVRLLFQVCTDSRYTAKLDLRNERLDETRQYKRRGVSLDLDIFGRRSGSAVYLETLPSLPIPNEGQRVRASRDGATSRKAIWEAVEPPMHAEVSLRETTNAGDLKQGM